LYDRGNIYRNISGWASCSYDSRCFPNFTHCRHIYGRNFDTPIAQEVELWYNKNRETLRA